LADSEDPAEATARLEEALERIAILARRPQPYALQAGTMRAGATHSGATHAIAAPDIDIARIAARLDTLISQIRAALGATTGGAAAGSD
jgi:hypothetical protein